MIVTPAIANAWIEYLARFLDARLNLEGLKELIQWTERSIAGMRAEGLIQETNNPSIVAYAESLKAAKERLALLTRVVSFTEETDPMQCTHKHERRDTGFFYSSMKILNCFECHGWQTIRQVIE